jgi:hypothetical protein
VKANDNFRDPETAERVGNVPNELVQQFGGDNRIIAIDTTKPRSVPAAQTVTPPQCRSSSRTSSGTSDQLHGPDPGPLWQRREPRRARLEWTARCLDFEFEIDNNMDGLRTYA